MSILETLVDAAARGVEVTIITNGGDAPDLRLKWDHQTYRDCAVSKYRAAGFDLTVVDMDGDGSWWELKRSKEKLAGGEVWECKPFYHFDSALLAAEAALMTEVRKRIAAAKAVQP